MLSVTPGMTPPCASVTDPWMVAVDCAQTDVERARPTMPAATSVAIRLMCQLLEGRVNRSEELASDVRIISGPPSAAAPNHCPRGFAQLPIRDSGECEPSRSGRGRGRGRRALELPATKTQGMGD